jgi:DNA repair protein RadD
MILRDYQLRAIDDVRQAYVDGHRKPLLVAPTGSGKTVIFSSIGKSAAERGKRVMILVHRQELLDQVDHALTAFDVPHGLIAATRRGASAPLVQVASVMTLVRRLDSVPAPHVLIIDEAHHASSGSWTKIIEAYPKARLLGVTATPTRLGGAGLGDVFDKLILGPSVSTLTEAGFLAPARIFAPPTIDMAGAHTLMGEFLASEVEAKVDKPKVTGDAIEHYQKLCPGLKAVVFCVSLQHAAHIAKGARDAGISAVEIDGRMDSDVRRRIVADFSRGLIQWLVTVDLVSEGFDIPNIEVGIFLRPTQSLGLWLQQAGRILRIAPGKTTAWLLDHAGNTLRHGLPSEDREWTLEGSKGNVAAKKEKPISARVCPKCFSGQRGGKPACIYCGLIFKVDSRKVQEESGELKEITPEETAKRRERSQIGMAAHSGNRARLEEIARIKGYKPGWVEYRLSAAQRKQGKQG